MRRVKGGDPDVADQPVPAQPDQFMHGVEPGRMVEPSPMERQEIDPVDAEPP